MAQSTPPLPFDHTVALAVDHARHLLDAARVIRRHGGALRYHPMTGDRSRPAPEFAAALAVVEQVVKDIQRGAEARGADEAALAAASEPRVGEVRAGHATVDAQAQTVMAALEVLRTTLADADTATVDAPYGSGAPRRHHPGALSTIVAERIEALARALEIVAILKANLALRAPA